MGEVPLYALHPNPETTNSKPNPNFDARNQTPGIRHTVRGDRMARPTPEARHSKPEIINPKAYTQETDGLLGTRNTECEARDPRPETQSTKLENGNQKLEIRKIRSSRHETRHT